MIVLIIGVVVLVLVAALATVMNMRAAAHANAAADEVAASVAQLVDVVAAVHLDGEERARHNHARLDDAIDRLSTHGDEMKAMAEQQVALRKQVKAVLRSAQQATAETKRNADRQYRQQKKVDLILYEDKIRRERLQAARERGELNG